MKGGVIALLPLHGMLGLWNELVCLAIPLTVILGIAWAVLRGDTSVSMSTGDTDAAREAEKVYVSTRAGHYDLPFFVPWE